LYYLAPVRRRELLALLWTSALGCSSKPEPARAPRAAIDLVTRDDARRRLAELATSYEALMRDHGLHEWSRYAGKLAEGPEAQQSMAKLRAAERDLFLEAERILDRFGIGLVSPRQEALWKKGALGLKLLGDPRAAELADELEAVINGHEYKLDGKPISRADLVLMRRSDDPLARRRARQLEHELHRRAAPIATELLERRHALAQELGQRSFYEALLELRGIGVERLTLLFGQLWVLTRAASRRLESDLRKAANARWLATWDVDYALHRLTKPPEERFPTDGALPFARRLFRAFGVDLDHPKIDLTVRQFAFSGQAITIEVPKDVRLVVSPNPGSRFYGTLIHELGHAYAGTRTRPDHVLYAGHEWVPGLSDPGFAEGLAEFFGRLLDEPRVLTDFLGLNADEATRLIHARRADGLIRLGRLLSSIAFERSALERPDANLDQMSLDTEQRITGVAVPPGTEPVWATSPFLATYPVYTHAYLMAAMFSLQVRDALKRRFGERWISPAASEFLTESAVADGARWTLDEKLVRATGSPLLAHAYARFLSGRS
jgi:hypothetical protein